MSKPKTPKHAIKMPVRDALKYAMQYLRTGMDTGNRNQVTHCRDFIHKYWSARNTGMIIINR